MSAIASYRALLRIVGPAYIVVAFLGRIPLAMSQLGTLTLVSQATGSYGSGGAAAGALAIANAASAPIFGALADRVGQRPVVLAQALCGAAGLVSIVFVVETGNLPLVIAVAAATGFALPQVGPLARVRWRPITASQTEQRRLVDAAFSYEGAADEASFVLGPALIGLLAVLVSPSGALFAAAFMLAVFGSWFALHRTSLIVPKTNGQHIASDGRLWSLAFAALVLAQMFIGMLFGSVQTGTASLTEAAGYEGATGLIHALLGIGSVIAGLAITALPERILYATRMKVAAVAMFTLTVPFYWVNSLGSLMVAITLLGFAVAPYMISNFALAGIIVPPHRVGTAMTFLAGATGLGYAIGAAVAGRLADHGGHQDAFLVTITATLLAVVLAFAAGPRLRKAPVLAQD